jgi:hypothetical protein
MRKLTTSISSKIALDRARARRRHFRGFLLAALLLALAPFVMEGALVVASNWRTLYGRATVVETPYTQRLTRESGIWFRAARRSLENRFEHLPWSPTLVVGCGLGLAFVLGLSMRHR